jgi:hypothetical protein
MDQHFKKDFFVISVGIVAGLISLLIYLGIHIQQDYSENRPDYNYIISIGSSKYFANGFETKNGCVFFRDVYLDFKNQERARMICGGYQVQKYGE